MKNRKIVFYFIPLIIVFLIGSWMWYVSVLYNEPYVIANAIVEEAKSGKENSEYILTREEWNEWKEHSKFKNIYKELNWKEFNEFVKFDPDKITIGQSSKLINKVKYYDRDYEIVLIKIRVFDNQNNALIHIKTAHLYMEKIHDSWKVIGGNVKM
ncbi:hypothetical protein [Desulfitibacter alkalitolerans]|uniref:hypothetical protein n=1 Tax=Desulfitibacter alkalitolerans TaxID=264641 RepID=UPI0004820205|nr:hypothetical protein [Desulfitibacter alkalitolerans]